MEKLDKVIAGLERCHRDVAYRDCDSCPYASAGSECERCLMEDALLFLKRMDDVRKDIWDVTNKNHQLVRKLKLTQAQRNSAWDKLARITGEREKAWLDEEVSE